MAWPDRESRDDAERGRLDSCTSQGRYVRGNVPSFAFAEPRIQQGYIEEATRIVHEASGGRQPKEHIWCNIVHAVDGGWGIAGQALTNQQLAEGVSQG
jgi:hypothetical protein